MPVDPTTGKYQEVSLVDRSGSYSAGRDLAPAPEKALASASKRLVAETQMQMKNTADRAMSMQPQIPASGLKPLKPSKESF